MSALLLAPPIVFVTLLLFMMLFSNLLANLSFKKTGREEGAGKSYACGEDLPTHLMQPDYSQFFPFAFFFTILHVVALMMATIPVKTMESFSMGIIYVLGAVVGLSILFRR